VTERTDRRASGGKSLECEWKKGSFTPAAASVRFPCPDCGRTIEWNDMSWHVTRGPREDAPYIWLQEDEPEGSAKCGCRVVGDLDGEAQRCSSVPCMRLRGDAEDSGGTKIQRSAGKGPEARRAVNTFRAGDVVTVTKREEAYCLSHAGNPVCFLEPAETGVIGAVKVAKVRHTSGDSASAALILSKAAGHGARAWTMGSSSS